MQLQDSSPPMNVPLKPRWRHAALFSVRAVELISDRRKNVNVQIFIQILSVIINGSHCLCFILGEQSENAQQQWNQQFRNLVAPNMERICSKFALVNREITKGNQLQKGTAVVIHKIYQNIREIARYRGSYERLRFVFPCYCRWPKLIRFSVRSLVKLSWVFTTGPL